MEARAYLKYLRISPRKVVILCDLILIGIYDALKILNLIPDRFIIIINQ